MTKSQLSWNISAECGLDAESLAQAQALADEVRRVDGIELKLEWEFAADRVPTQSSNFCCRAGQELIGYALLEGNGPELEVPAAVLPSFRRQGILRSLIQAVRAEAEQRGAAQLLLVSYRASASGTAATAALGLPYVSSEYRMEAEAATMPAFSSGLLQLVQVDKANAAALAQMTESIFGSASTVLHERLQKEGSRYFFAELAGVRIGQIGVVAIDGSIYIRAVGILPEYRRRGYGRQLLAAALSLMRLEGYTHFMLDVATNNPQALSLYHACGFCEGTIYDYYTVPLTKIT